MGLRLGEPATDRSYRRLGGRAPEHLAQLPPRLGEPPRLLFVPPVTGYHKQDLVQNDPFLRDEEVVLVAHGAAAEARLARQLLPGSERIWSNGFDSAWARRPGRYTKPSPP